MNHLLLPSFASPAFRQDDPAEPAPYMLDMQRAEAERAAWVRPAGPSSIARLISRLRQPPIAARRVRPGA